VTWAGVYISFTYFFIEYRISYIGRILTRPIVQSVTVFYVNISAVK